MAGRHRAEVHERRLEFERGTQRAIVRLIQRAGAVGVGEQRAALVIRVAIGVLERRRQRERGGAALHSRSMDPLLERAEADALTLELEPGFELRERDKIVVVLAEATRRGDRGLTQREVRVDGRHAANCGAAARRQQDDLSTPRLRPGNESADSCSHGVNCSPPQAPTP